MSITVPYSYITMVAKTKVVKTLMAKTRVALTSVAKTGVAINGVSKLCINDQT